MTPALCFNKCNTFSSDFSFYIVVVVITSCFIQGSHQHRLSSFSYDGLEEIENFAQKHFYTHSNLKHENWLHPGQELVFVTTTPKPIALRPGQELIFVTTTSKPSKQPVVYVNNKPAVPTMMPFMPKATTATPEFLDCLAKCRTTSEFNPVCATNRQVYANEQQFFCARHCGAAIEIVRYGSCEGLFPMARG